MNLDLELGDLCAFDNVFPRARSHELDTRLSSGSVKVGQNRWSPTHGIYYKSVRDRGSPSCANCR